MPAYGREGSDLVVSNTLVTISLEDIDPIYKESIPVDSYSNRFSRFIERCRRSKTGVLIVCSLALFTDMIIYSVLFPILPSILRDIGMESKSDRDFYSAFLFSMYALGLFLATPLFGIFSDRYQNRRIPMIIGMFGLCISTILFPFSTSLTHLIIARIFQGISAAASWVVGMALVCDTYPPEQLSFVMGIVMGFNNLGFMSGPILGSVISTEFSLKFPFYICSAFAGLDFLGRLFIKPVKYLPDTLTGSSKGNLSVEASATLDPSEKNKSISNRQKFVNYIIQSEIISLVCIPEVMMISLAVIIGASSFSIIESILPSYVQESRFFLSNNWTMIVLLCIILPNIFTSVIIGYISEKISRPRLIFFGMLIHSISPVLVFMANDLSMLLLAAVYYGITVSIFMTPTQPELASILSRRNRHLSYANIYAIFNISYSIGMVFLPVIAASFINIFGSFLLGTLFIPLISILFAPIFMISTLRLERKSANLDASLSTLLANAWYDIFYPIKNTSKSHPVLSIKETI